MGETLHRSPRNTESIRVKRRVFRLVPPTGGLLVFSLTNRFGATDRNMLQWPPDNHNKTSVVGLSENRKHLLNLFN